MRLWSGGKVSVWVGVLGGVKIIILVGTGVKAWGEIKVLAGVGIEVRGEVKIKVPVGVEIELRGEVKIKVPVGCVVRGLRSEMWSGLRFGVGLWN